MLCSYPFVLLRFLVSSSLTDYPETEHRQHRRRVGETKECQGMRLPGVPREEAGQDPFQMRWVPSGDLLLLRSQRAALAGPHEPVQGAAAEMRPPGVQ